MEFVAEDFSVEEMGKLEEHLLGGHMFLGAETKSSQLTIKGARVPEKTYPSFVNSGALVEAVRTAEQTWQSPKLADNHL